MYDPRSGCCGYGMGPSGNGFGMAAVILSESKVKGRYALVVLI